MTRKCDICGKADDAVELHVGGFIRFAHKECASLFARSLRHLVKTLANNPDALIDFLHMVCVERHGQNLRNRKRHELQRLAELYEKSHLGMLSEEEAHELAELREKLVR